MSVNTVAVFTSTRDWIIAMKAPTEPATLSIPAAAERLGIGRSLAYALVQRDEFPVRVLRLGTRRLVSRVELERYLAGEVEPRDAA